MKEQILEFLKKTTLFSGVPDQYLDAMIKYLTPLSFEPGELIIKEGTKGDAFYIITAGKVEVFIKDEEFDIETSLAKLGTGVVIGEMALLTGEKRNASIRAIEKTKTLVLKDSIFYKLLEKSPNFAISLAKVMAIRVNELNKNKGFKLVDPNSYDIPQEIYSLVPIRVVQDYKVLPLGIEKNDIVLGMVDPTNSIALDEIKRCYRAYTIKPVTISLKDFDSVFKKLEKKGYFSSEKKKSIQVNKKLKIHYYKGDEDGKTDKTNTVNIGPVLDEIISESIINGASDIHIEAERDYASVRYRIDGRLVPKKEKLPKNYLSFLISRIKVLASLKISEQRLPQDGRISLSVDGKDIDLRVSTLPSKYGEKAVLRILDSSHLFLKVDNLLINNKVSSIVKKQIFKPNGMVMVTGPTGSGKTTTLYSFLNEIWTNSPYFSIMTVEDPIEYSLEGITQVQVNEGIGLTFDSILRSILRQDPDVILLGETRDKETAKIAIEASLTGHMVLTSLHTNDSIGAIDRLKEMGVESYQISSSVNAIIAQRLARRVCPSCQVEEELPDTIYKELVKLGVLSINDKPKFKRGKGCNACNFTGTKGRIGIYEIFILTDKIKDMIYRDQATSDIKKEAINTGSLLTINKYASFLLKNGLIDPLEILRTIKVD